MIWWNKYVGIPFEDHGRRGKLDCYGLIRHIFKEEQGVELPALTRGYESTIDRESIERMFKLQPVIMGFEKVPFEEAKPFDVFIIRIKGRDCHLGLVVRKGLMIHTEIGSNSVIEDYRRPHIRPRIKETWRYVGT